MTGYLKDDLTVALDDVDRILLRAVTVHEQLSHLAVDPAVAERLRDRGRQFEAALVRFDQAREAAGQVPEREDPERGQLEAWWLRLKAWVGQVGAEDSVKEAVESFDASVLETIERARALRPEAGVLAALDALRAEIGDLDPA